MMSTLSVEIWSDLICPWCWIGLHRFERAVGAFEHAEDLEVVHRAYRLAPGAIPLPLEQAIMRSHGISRSQITEMTRRIETVARTEGLPYELSNALIGDTMDGHRIVKLAGTLGRQSAMIERFFMANFSEGRPPFGRERLLELASDAGLDRADAGAVLDGDRFRAEVEIDQRSLEAAGGHGVPFFLIGGGRAVSGALSSDTFSQFLMHEWRELRSP